MIDCKVVVSMSFKALMCVCKWRCSSSELRSYEACSGSASLQLLCVLIELQSMSKDTGNILGNAKISCRAPLRDLGLIQAFNVQEV